MNSAWKKIRPARLGLKNQTRHAGPVLQVDLAAALNVTQATVSRIENGKMPASKATVEKILAAIEKLSARQPEKA